MGENQLGELQALDAVELGYTCFPSGFVLFSKNRAQAQIGQLGTILPSMDLFCLNHSRPLFLFVDLRISQGDDATFSLTALLLAIDLDSTDRIFLVHLYVWTVVQLWESAHSKFEFELDHERFSGSSKRGSALHVRVAVSTDASEAPTIPGQNRRLRGPWPFGHAPSKARPNHHRLGD